MSYKLLALDIDGTLLNSKSELTPGTILAVQNAVQAGLKVCLVSGRRPRGMSQYSQTIGLIHPLVGFNGGVVADATTLTPLRANTIPRQLVHDALGEYERQNLCAFAYRSSATPPDVYYSVAPTWPDSQYYVEFEQRLGNMHRLPTLWKHMNFDPLRIMVGGSEEESIVARELAAQHLDFSQLKYFHTKHYNGTWYYEIYPIQSTKSNGLRFLCDYFSCDQSEVVAVGDHVNDLDMIEFAGLGVAMGNAQPEVKDKADLIIGHHDEDGLAKFITERLL